MNKTVHSSAALLPPGIPISAQRIALPVTSLPKSVRCLTCTALNCWVRRKTLQRLHRELLNFGNDRNESHRGRHLKPGLSRAQAMLNLFDDEGRIQFDKDRLAARQYFLQHVNQNTVFFHNLAEKLRYLVEEGYYDAAV